MATIAPISCRSRCTYTSIASAAAASPAAARREHRAQVAAGNARKTRETGLSVEPLLDYIAPEIAHEREHDTGVDGSRPGRHHETFERRPSHRGVDGTAAPRRTQRSTGAEVTTHDSQRVVSVAPDELRRAPRRERVRKPVETEPTYAPLVAPLLRQCVRRGGRGHGRVKRRVEARDLGPVRQETAQGAHSFDGTRLVKRSQRRQREQRVARPRRRSGPGREIRHRRAQRGARRHRLRAPTRETRRPRVRRPARANRSRSRVASTTSPGPITRSLILLDPAFTTSTRISAARPSRVPRACPHRARARTRLWRVRSSTMC